MSSLVLELQREAFDQTIFTSSLLRKAYVLSRKLKVEEFSKWADSELNGYKDEDDVPDYRVLKGEKIIYDINFGLVDADFERSADAIDWKSITYSLTEIETLVKQGTEKNSYVRVKYSSEMQRNFKSFMGDSLELYLRIPINRYREILEKVRNIIIEWTLKLEEERILGDGMSFSKEEKEKAENTNITNIFENVINSPIQQGTKDLNQINSIKEFEIGDLNFLLEKLFKLQEEVESSEVKEELASDIEVIKAQINSPKPKKIIIKETLKSIRNITEGITGSLIASSIQIEVMKILTKI